VPKVVDGKETYPDARRPDWPEAEFIVGNPPFIGGKDIRERCGGSYTETLWRVHKHINESADYVMYWWDRAAHIVAKGKARRFGLVTTNSITQVLSRRVVAKHLDAKKPVSLVLAIPDHPWTKASDEAAQVRIAMTVAAKELCKGHLLEVVNETDLDTDQPEIARGWLGVGNDPRYSKSRCFDPFPFPECSEELKAQIRAVSEELDAHRKVRQAEHLKLTLTQMYNVLEKLKAGEPLSETDERIKEEGLVLILKELHERLDRLVFQAYGWSEDLSEEQILERLVALNQERAEEEKQGKVRWLRPDYQIPRFGSDAEKARLKAEKEKSRAAQEAMFPEAEPEIGKPRFPTEDELAETAAVMSVLATASRPLSISEIASSFAQGKRVEKRVALTILALMRLGHLASTDRGESFSLRRSA
jgi:hypothetical protein